jgi:hypothetical protein
MFIFTTRTNTQSTCKIFDRNHEGNWGAYDAVFREEIKWMEPGLGDFHCKDVPFLAITKPTWFNTQDKIDFIRNSHSIIDMNRTIHLCLLLAVPVLLVTGGIGTMILGGSVLAFPPIIIGTLCCCRC